MSGSTQILKQEILDKIILILEKDYSQLNKITKQAREDVIHNEMKQEGKYDTRAIEAGYLAGAQQRRLQVLKAEINTLRNLDIKSKTNSVALSSLVEVTQNNKSITYFITAKSGGITINLDNNKVILIISLSSPLAKGLLGKAVDDYFELNIGKKNHEIEIIKIT